MDINLFLSTLGINTYTSNVRFFTYFIFLTFLLTYIPLYYGLYNIFIKKETEQVILCMIMFGDIYIYISLFRSNLIDFIKKFINEDINPNIKNKYFYPSLNITFFISIILAVTFLILNINNIQLKLISDLTDNIYLSSILSFLYLYFSSQIKIFSTLIFLSTFYIISQYLKDYSDLLSNNNYSIPEVTQQFIEIRHKYGNSVNNTNNILSGAIIFHFIPSCYFIINLFEGKQVSLSNILSFIYFILCITSFHFILKEIHDSIDKIRNTIDNNRYLRLFLERKKDSYSLNIELNELDNYNSNQINFKNYLLELENGDSIDWMIINNVTSQNWKSFDIFGFDFKNNNIVFRLLSIIIALWIGKSII